MILDLSEPVQRSGDLGILHAYLTALIGQRCLKVDLSYGNELMLHMGDAVAYRHPKLADEKKGSWILGSRASGWRLLLDNPPFLIQVGPFPEASSGWLSEPWVNAAWHKANRQPISGKQIEEKAAQLAGRTIEDVRLMNFRLPTPAAAGIGLIVRFAGSSSLAIVPNPEPDDGDEPLPDWELFTPHHTYLRVGPGLLWAYLPSNGQTNTAVG